MAKVGASLDFPKRAMRRRVIHFPLSIPSIYSSLIRAIWVGDSASLADTQNFFSWKIDVSVDPDCCGAQFAPGGYALERVGLSEIIIDGIVAQVALGLRQNLTQKNVLLPRHQCHTSGDMR